MSGRILIADSMATNRIVLKVKLSLAHYDVLQATTGTEVLSLAIEERPNLIILDNDLPDMTGLEICASLTANPDTSGSAVIIVTDHCDNDLKIAALRAGANECLAKPLDAQSLLARMRSLQRVSETRAALERRRATVRDLGFEEHRADTEPAGHIAFVDWPDVADISALAFHDVSYMSVPTALSAAPADVYVVSSDPDNPSEGQSVVINLRNHHATRHAGILFIHPPDNPRAAARALDLGANDVIEAGFSPEELALRIKAQMRTKLDADHLRRQVEDGLRLAVLDPLTGMYNRRYAMAHCARIASKAEETGHPYAVMIADIDRFKSINDSFGHKAGDVVLSKVAARLSDNLRGVDLVARIGGEEFLIALSETSVDQALTTAERLCALIGDRPFRLPDNRGDIHVTLSIGLAVCETAGTGDESFQDQIDQADKALLAAKNDGRNTVRFDPKAA